jgi:hypothetical protein
MTRVALNILMGLIALTGARALAYRFYSRGGDCKLSV